MDMDLKIFEYENVTTQKSHGFIGKQIIEKTIKDVLQESYVNTINLLLFLDIIEHYMTKSLRKFLSFTMVGSELTFP